MAASPKISATVWIGRALSALVVLALLADAAVNLFAPGMISAEMQATNFSPRLAFPLGIIILACVVFYAINGGAGRDSGDRIFGRCDLHPFSHRRIRFTAATDLPAARRDDLGRPLPARCAHPGVGAVQPIIKAQLVQTRDHLL